MVKKIEKAKSLISEYKNNSVLLFTGDKESTVLLELARGLNLPTIFVDTGLYRQEIYDYLRVAERHWRFRAGVLRDDKVPAGITASGKTRCYNLLKEKIILPYLKRQKVSTLIEPIKLEKYTAEKEGIKSVFPLSNFSELDIWRYIREKDLPYCDLYNHGYKDVGCEPCSKSGIPREVDELEISRRLKGLGYL
jgi:phosphoadenosine phosphosulfate reductase